MEFDVTPFPITISGDRYSQDHVYFKGSVTSDANYDSANETACDITLLGGGGSVSFEFGIENGKASI